MSNLELALNMLAEVWIAEISKAVNPYGIEASKKVAKRGGDIARNAREQIEESTGKSALSQKNAKGLNLIEYYSSVVVILLCCQF